MRKQVMTENHSNRTRATLLKNAGLGDEVAWVQLDELYRPMLKTWAVRAGAQPADADEAASEVLCVLVTFLRGFEYDASQSFRGYLRTMLRNQLSRLYRKTPHTPDDSMLKDIVVDERSEREADRPADSRGREAEGARNPADRPATMPQRQHMASMGNDRTGRSCHN